MTHLHDAINETWKTLSIWRAFKEYYTFDFCKSRVAEYELYYCFVSEHYPERVHLETLTNEVNYMV